MGVHTSTGHTTNDLLCRVVWRKEDFSCIEKALKPTL